MNEYVKFYEKNNISPVRQNIDDFNQHIKRRSSLYRQLGVLPNFFKGKKVLEVGPGGGYNALATYTFEPSKYVFVEPNKTGYEELQANFSKYGFSNNVEFYNCFLESFESDETFDIVICEGLIQGLPNRDEFLSQLSNKVADGGILIITSADEISMFFEILRRYLSNELIKNEANFNQQLEILVSAFSSHLDTLKGMTRRYDDWCADLICDAIYNHTFSVSDAIEYFKEQYFFYGASPNIFQDYRWYKALPTSTIEFNKYFITQFDELRHNFIDCQKVYDKQDKAINKELSIRTRELILIIKSLEKKDGEYSKSELINIFDIIGKLLNKFDPHLCKILMELKQLVESKENIDAKDVSNLTLLQPMFGRGQTFISFNKAFND